jgi:hypothetical protein
VRPGAGRSPRPGLSSRRGLGESGRVVFSYSVSPTSPPTTSGAGSVITIDGGPNATVPIAGPHNDPADFYGIVLVFVAIAVAIVATRWIFGRRGGSQPR